MFRRTGCLCRMDDALAGSIKCARRGTTDNCDSLMGRGNFVAL